MQAHGYYHNVPAGYSVHSQEAQDYYNAQARRREEEEERKGIVDWRPRLILVLKGATVDDREGSLPMRNHYRQKLKEAAEDEKLVAVLADIGRSQEMRYSTRITAIEAVNYHIRHRWTPNYPGHAGGLVPRDDPARNDITRYVFNMLSDKNTEIRVRAAQTMTLILDSTEATGTDDDLMRLLFGSLYASPPGPWTTHGVTEAIVGHLNIGTSRQKLLPFLPYLERLQPNVLGKGSPAATPATRAKLIGVFKTCLEGAVELQYPRDIMDTMRKLLPAWLKTFEELLFKDTEQDVQDPQCWDRLYMKQQMFELLPALLDTPFVPQRNLMDFLYSAVEHLRIFYPTYREHFLASRAGPPLKTENDKAANLAEVMCPVFGYIASAIRSGRVSSWFDVSNVRSVVEVVFIWAQMTFTDEEEWRSEPDIFVEPSYEKQDFSLRVVIYDVLTALLALQPALTIEAIQIYVQEAVEEGRRSEGSRLSDCLRWRRLEGCLAIIDSQAQFLMSKRPAARPIVEYLLEQVRLMTPDLADTPFLHGRVLLFVGQYAPWLSSVQFTRFLKNAVEALNNSQAELPDKVCAIKLCQLFYNAAPHYAVLNQVISQVQQDIKPWASHEQEPIAQLARDALNTMNEFHVSHLIRVSRL